MLQRAGFGDARAGGRFRDAEARVRVLHFGIAAIRRRLVEIDAELARLGGRLSELGERQQRLLAGLSLAPTSRSCFATALHPTHVVVTNQHDGPILMSNCIQQTAGCGAFTVSSGA